MIGLTLTVTVSNVRTSIENSMEVQVLVLIFLGLLRSGGRSIAMGIKDSLVQGLTTTSPCLGTSAKGMLGKKIKASDGIASKRSFNSFSSSSKGNFFPTTSSIGAAMRSNPSARVEELDKKLLLFMFTVQPLSQDSNRAIFNLNCRKMHKNESEIHSGNFRVCSADFRVCSGNFRVCFRGEKWQKKWKSIWRMKLPKSGESAGNFWKVLVSPKKSDWNRSFPFFYMWFSHSRNSHGPSRSAFHRSAADTSSVP